MKEYQFDGFSSPNGTFVPDDLFDVLAPQLTEAELRVLLYIIRRTFGFKKFSDNISLKQMVGGITTHDGKVLDHGAGVVRSAATRAVKGLVVKRVIVAEKNRSAARGDEPTTYSLRFKEGAPVAQPGFSKGTRGVLEEDRPRSSKGTHNEQTDKSSNSKTEVFVEGEEANAHRRRDQEFDHLDAVIGDVSRSLKDEAHLASNCSQARRLLRASRASEQAFIARVYEAQSITNDRHDVVRPAAFFFRVLRDLLGVDDPQPVRDDSLRPDTARSAPSDPAIAFPAPSAPRKIQNHRPKPIPGSKLTTAVLWTRTLEHLGSTIGQESVRIYFHGTELEDCDERTAVVSVRNGFVAGQLANRFTRPVTEFLTRVVGRPIGVEFRAAGVPVQRGSQSEHHLSSSRARTDQRLG